MLKVAANNVIGAIATQPFRYKVNAQMVTSCAWQGKLEKKLTEREDTGTSGVQRR